MSRLPLRLVALAGAAAVAGAGVAAVATGASAATSTLRDAATARGVFVGAAVQPELFTEAPYASTLAGQYSALTPENVMKWDGTEPQQNQFTFAKGDQVTQFAADHGQKVRAHALVWHEALPGWVQGLSGDALRQAMLNHISNVAGHFKGKVYSWDVVNEPFNEDGSLRPTVFRNGLGDGYIAEALQAAHTADPGAELYVNDYNVEGVNAKSDALYALVKGLKQNGVPIDGVGLQGHFTLYGVPDSLQQNIQRFADLGLDVAITEVDVRMQLPVDDQKLAQQAADYRKALRGCLAVPRCVGFTTWGFTDKYSWIPGFFGGQGAALPFDEQYQPKPAVAAMLEELGSSPSPSPSASPSPPASPSPSASPSTSPSPSPSGAACTIGFRKDQWDAGFVGYVTVTNSGSTPITGWTLQATLPAGQQFTSGWSAGWSQTGTTITATGLDYNGSLQPGGSASIGFQGTRGADGGDPTGWTLNGSTCAVA